MTGPVVHHSLDSEASVLGGVFLRPEVIGALSLDPFDFFHPKHQAVFQAMRNLEARTAPIDPVTVEAELARMGKADAVGGLGFLSELTLRVPSRDNVLHYAQEVTRKARRRTAIKKVSDLLGQLQKPDDGDDESAISEAAHELLRLETKTEDPSRPLGDLMRDEAAAIQRDLDSPRGAWVAAMPTGIQRLDLNIGGIPLGNTTVILGDTGVGKTSLAMQLLRAAVAIANDRPVLFSYEDSFKSYARRGLAQESGVATQRIGARRFADGEAGRVIVGGLRGAPRRRERIVRFRGQGMAEVCRTIRRLRARGPEAGAASVARMVIIDYWQAIKAPPGRRDMSPVEAFAENARMIEDVADSEDIAVVIMSQVNDETEKRKGVPSLRDVAGGRDVVKGAKLVLGIHRPALFDDKADPNDGRLLVLKNNAGETNRSIPVRLELSTHQIRDVEEP